MVSNNGKITGILGAVIIHLIAGILFMLVKLGSLDIKEYTREYAVALEEKSVPENPKIVTDSKGTSIEKIFQGDQEVLNIARNLANQPDVKINAADYIDKVKDELIASGKLGKDNYIDEQKKEKEKQSDGSVEIEKKEPVTRPVDKKTESQDMAANYSGPTRIYYNLPGRVHSYLPVPIYKCEGSGKAVLKIEINQKGTVLSAKIIPEESTTADPCLIDAAIKSALISTFRAEIKAEKVQTGTITYHFVAQ
jgi:hypothetical protein